MAYQPPLPTNVRGYNGNPVQTFARERRVELSYDEYPPLVVNAFVSAEDKTFFSHGGIDYPGLIGAVVDYTTKSITGGRAKGGSTITQQVAKYLLKDDEYAISRKIREAILAFRLEDTLSKEQILELYLNSIFLGRNAYGVQAASRAYFDKDVTDLTLPEAAYLAVLPKAPSNYDPVRATDRALGRRNYVLRELANNGYITEEQRAAAAATLARRRANPRVLTSNARPTAAGGFHAVGCGSHNSLTVRTKIGRFPSRCVGEPPRGRAADLPATPLRPRAGRQRPIPLPAKPCRLRPLRKAKPCVRACFRLRDARCGLEAPKWQQGAPIHSSVP